MTRHFTEITVVGDDKTGLIANVTSLLFERGINIEDVDQAVRDGVFRMTLHADTTEMVCTRDTLRDAIGELADDLDVDVQMRFPDDRDARGVAVLVTKESHCLEELLSAAAADTLDAEIRVVIGNHAKLEPIADAYDVPFHDVGDESGTPDEDRILDLFDEHAVDLVVLARYMRILSPDVVFRYEGRIINIHPSLLPAFPGAQAYRQAVEEGVRVAGVTAHYVTTDLDQGPIITQRAFEVPDEADAREVRQAGQPLEADALREAVRLHLDDDVYVHHGRTSLRDDAESEAYQLGLPRELEDTHPDGPVDEPLADPSDD